MNEDNLRRGRPHTRWVRSGIQQIWQWTSWEKQQDWLETAQRRCHQESYDLTGHHVAYIKPRWFRLLKFSAGSFTISLSSICLKRRVIMICLIISQTCVTPSAKPFVYPSTLDISFIQLLQPFMVIPPRPRNVTLGKQFIKLDVFRTSPTVRVVTQMTACWTHQWTRADNDANNPSWPAGQWGAGTRPRGVY